jgi:NADH:ubiquinone oxidoreductase subunit
MIPPKWHGWLSHQYDDVPTPESPSFYDPFFQKAHDWNYSYTAFKMYTPRMSNFNPRALDYAEYRNNRYAKEWEPTTKRA